ncbi:hypothetical protein [Streptomyces sp. NPDC001401]|uniref:hypothetical protein n=1 Tax=Streptomyces sp. NPDC001401 TaxID=3364570 RepID=UPI0036BE145F
MDADLSLDEAIALADRAADEEESAQGAAEVSPPRQETEDLLTGYVNRICADATLWDNDPKIVARHTHLAQCLLDLGMKKESRDLTNTTIRRMERAESDAIVYTEAELWNHLGALLADQGDLTGARATLVCALGRAHQDESQERYETRERAAILANLSEASLQMNDLEAADFWADKVLAELRRPWEPDLTARLAADRVKLAIARTRHDAKALESSLARFEESVQLFVEREGSQALRALDAQIALASARQESHPDGQHIAELEYLHATTHATLGPEHRETIIAQAALAAAEFDAVDGWEGSGEPKDAPRMTAAIKALEAARNYAVESPDLGQGHPQTRILRDALADMHAAAKSADPPLSELGNLYDYHLEKVYLPHESDARNSAKQQALARESDEIRLIAHAGASYFLKEIDLFYGPVVDALQRNVHFKVVISSPWSTLAAFLPGNPTADPGNYGNIDELVRRSDYYQKAFRPVVRSYRRLKKRYPDHVELRVTPLDIPGSTLLTTDVGFFEPYITSNPGRRTRRGMSVFEVEFRKDSQYHPDSLEEFNTQWELSSTWDEFEANEKEHIETLRAEMQAHGYVRDREKVRRGEVPRP